MVTVKCITWYIRLIRLDSLLVVTRAEASRCQASSFTAALHSLRIWPIMWNSVCPGLCWTTGGMFRVNRDILGKGTGRNRNRCDDWGGQQPRGNLTTLLPTGDKQTHKSFKEKLIGNTTKTVAAEKVENCWLESLWPSCLLAFGSFVPQQKAVEIDPWNRDGSSSRGWWKCQTTTGCCLVSLHVCKGEDYCIRSRSHTVVSKL